MKEHKWYKHSNKKLNSKVFVRHDGDSLYLMVQNLASGDGRGERKFDTFKLNRVSELRRIGCELTLQQSKEICEIHAEDSEELLNECLKNISPA
jgi:hypothetical protein